MVAASPMVVVKGRKGSVMIDGGDITNDCLSMGANKGVVKFRGKPAQYN